MRPLRVPVLLHLVLACLLSFTALPNSRAYGGDGTHPLLIGSFNVQVFGQSKVSKPLILDTLLQIIPRYDLLLIQEIRDNDNAAIFILLDKLRSYSGRNYRALVSERLGRGDMKEQYAYFYDADLVSAHESYVFDDVHDKFEREPFVTRFTGLGHDFVMAGIHITPTAVAKELAALNDVYRDIKHRLDTSNIFIAGDFNADCIYYKPAVHGFQYFDDEARVLVADEVDTTTAPNSCAYDRVLGFGEIQSYASEAEAFDFMTTYQFDLPTAKLISDHFPVEFEIKAKDDYNAEAHASLSASVGAYVPFNENKTSEASCGINNYLTVGGYCYGEFANAKKRVIAICCQ